MGYRGGVQHDPRSDPEFLAAYGDAVIALRDARQFDRRKLAESAGISYSYLSAIETGQKLPSPRLEAAITTALGVSEAQFLEQVNGALRYHDGMDGTPDNAPRHAGANDDALPLRSREGGSTEHPWGLGPSAALAELRVLVPAMSPQGAARIVGITATSLPTMHSRKTPNCGAHHPMRRSVNFVRVPISSSGPNTSPRSPTAASTGCKAEPRRREAPFRQHLRSRAHR